jgi:outer membrane protein OmpA-like peptidoglycan-associated protein
LTAPAPIPPAQLPAGQSSVLIGGQPARVTVAPLPNGGTSLNVAGVVITAAPQRPDGTAPAGGAQSPQSPQSGQGGTGFQPGGNVAVNISGLAPQSQVSAFLFSEPTLLGRLEVGPNGDVVGELKIPPSLATGNHTLQFTGWLPSGEPLVVSTPITVSAVPRTTSKSRTILFDYLSTSLTPAARKAITGLVAQAKSWATPRTVVVGYVRESGATTADRRLAKARALMVARQLRAAGMTGPVQIGPLKSTGDTTASARKVVITTR